MTQRKTTPAAGPNRFPGPPALPDGVIVHPYKPSWVDGLTNGIDRLPGPTWVFYVLVGAAYTLVFLFLEAAMGSGGSARVLPRIFLALQPVYFLTVIHSLDRVAQDAARRYFASRPEASAAAEAFRYQLTTLPRIPTWIASLGAMLGVVYFLLAGDPESLSELGLATGSAGLALTLVHFSVMWLLLGALIYHTFHQLRAVHQIYATLPVADVYATEPYYAFTGLALRTALLITLNNYGWVAASPSTLHNPFSLGLTAFLALLAVVMFVWPLWGAHQMLVSSKAGALAQNALRFKDAAADLHRRLDSRKPAGMDDLNKSLASLEIERTALMRIPTWPWHPGTFRGLVAALGLPIAVWLIQYVLQKVLG
jgi:hypothetical protein